MDETQLVRSVAAALSIDERRAGEIVRAFERFIAAPLRGRFDEIKPRDVAKRNPFVYATLGVTRSDEWVDRVLADKLTSSAEGLVGNWLEEVARIVCGGFKPGSGVDLQRELDDRVELYALQTTTNTKSAGGWRSDIRALHAAAGALRAQRRHVELYVGFLFGRALTTTSPEGIKLLSSDDLWERLTHDRSFLPKLLHACTLMSALYTSAQPADRQRIAREVAADYGDGHGGIDWSVVLAKRRPRGGQRND